MPEITDAELRQFVRYQNLGTPEEVEKKISELEKDNKSQRDDIRELKKAPTVPEGGRIVTKEEADEIDAYRTLGKPDEIKVTVEKASTLETELATTKRALARDAAAKALGLDGKDLSPFAGSDALTYEVREEEADGKTVQAAYVTDAEGKEHRLAEYGKAQWGRPFEALLTTNQPQQTGGTRVNPMPSGNGTPAGAYDPVADGKRMAEEQKGSTDNKLAFR